MLQIPILNIPNQTLSLQIDNNLYDIGIYATKDDAQGNSGISAVTIVRNNITIVSGMRAVYNYPLLPYFYETINYGNFIFTTQNDEYPDWRQFGITQFLIYVSYDELLTIQNEVTNGGTIA
jgi:hypothetical protein